MGRRKSIDELECIIAKKELNPREYLDIAEILLSDYLGFKRIDIHCAYDFKPKPGTQKTIGFAPNETKFIGSILRQKIDAGILPMPISTAFEVTYKLGVDMVTASSAYSHANGVDRALSGMILSTTTFNLEKEVMRYLDIPAHMINAAMEKYVLPHKITHKHNIIPYFELSGTKFYILDLPHLLEVYKTMTKRT